MDVGNVFTAILAGIVIGALGRLVLPGRQAIGWILTFALGLVGAFLGAYLGDGLGFDVWWQVFIVQVIVAAVLVFLVTGLLRSRSADRRA